MPNYNRTNKAEIEIKLRIFQGDSLSPSLFSHYRFTRQKLLNDANFHRAENKLSRICG